VATAQGFAKLEVKPTRQSTITDIQIGAPDAGDFQIDQTNWAATGNPAAYQSMPTAANPWVVPINTTLKIPLLFKPNSVGNKTASITVFGDFSKCDDPDDMLIGTSYTLSALVNDVPFGTILTCYSKDGISMLTNPGSAPIVVTGIDFQNSPNGDFSIVRPSFPDTIQPGGNLQIPVTFAPGSTGLFQGKIIYHVTNLDGSFNIGDFTSNLTGTGETITVDAHINTDYRAYPGTPLDIPVTLDGDLSAAKVTSLYITVYFNSGMLRLDNASKTDPAKFATLLKGTLLEGWTADVTTLNDSLMLVHLTSPDPNTIFLTGTGSLLNLKFTTFVGNKDTSSLPFDVTLENRPCANVVPHAGFARLDSVCGLNFRLIESFGKTYALDQNSPNPFNPTTDITFSLGLDGYTRLTVYNAAGEKVATLLDQYMQPGSYSISWDASKQPSGLYYYRLESGVWTRTNTMILRK
jgi:hypothetical protein